ncbi:unnamed protein product [Spirodela intermedia]|uniref:Uncharacterized protein n=1 Tax=Spirodela intermedia TaxID=51605 RepID=A0A7I8KNT8_SPIIN|nr:unnamed protein product [Spirodela intermedia]
MASFVVSSAVARLSNPLQRPPQFVRLHGRPSLGRTALLFPSGRLARGVSVSLRVSASASSSAAPSARISPPVAPFSSEVGVFLADSTRTVASLAALAFAVSKIFVNSVRSFAEKVAAPPSAQDLAKLLEMKGNLMCSVGPLFFAALRDRPRGDLNTPLTVVAAGLARWLEIYSGVLMIRVLLSWFPNIPWHRQPLSAIRDLCDPYLNLFRNIIPPIFDALDVSPLLAFAVLGTLSSILNSSKGGY